MSVINQIQAVSGGKFFLIFSNIIKTVRSLKHKIDINVRSSFISAFANLNVYLFTKLLTSMSCILLIIYLTQTAANLNDALFKHDK